ALRSYNLHPSLNLKADGPQNKLALTLDATSEAGAVKGAVMTDVQAPDFSARGDIDVRNLNLAPLLNDPTQKSDITGHVNMDVAMASAPADQPAIERLRGRFA